MPERAREDFWGGPTRWTLVRRAAGSETGEAGDRAWAELVERYRAPVERTVRYWLRGHSQVDEAVDDFFAHLLLKGILPKADPDQGRFRAFVQGVIRRYVQQWKRASRVDAAGGEEEAGSLLGDLGAREDLDQVELDEERAWAEGLLAGALAQLVREKPRDGQLLLDAHGIPGGTPIEREALAASAGIKTNALDQALFRARKRLRELVIDAVAESVATQEDFESERAVMLDRLLSAHPRLDLRSDTSA